MTGPARHRGEIGRTLRIFAAIGRKSAMRFTAETAGVYLVGTSDVWLIADEDGNPVEPTLVAGGPAVRLRLTAGATFNARELIRHPDHSRYLDVTYQTSAGSLDVARDAEVVARVDWVTSRE